MNGPVPPSGRLTPRQALGWGLVLVVTVILVVVYFLLGRSVRPLLDL